MTTYSSEEISGEEVKIWSHISSNDLKEYYFVYQDWWWKNMSRPEHLGKKRNYSFLGLFRKYCEADIYELIRCKYATIQKVETKAESAIIQFY